MTADVHSLAGAYALHALPPDEREHFERHLAMCAACRSEVDELLATAARLGAAAAQPAPPELRWRVLARAEATRQLPPADDRDIREDRPGWRRALAPLAAAAAAAAVTLGVVGVVADREPPDAVAPEAVVMGEEAVNILTAPDARTIALDADAPIRATLVAAASTGRGLVTLDGLEPLDERQYVLWVLRDGQPERVASVALDGRDAGAVVVEGLDTASGVALSVEPPGEAPAPTGPIIVQGEI